MKGYYKNESATAETLKNGWLHTGDLGYMDRDGFLVVVGRAKALLISEDGEKYSPEEIEEAIISSSECIQQIMIYNDHEKYTTALVTLNKKAVEELIKKEGISSYTELNKCMKDQILLFAKQPEFKDKFPGKWVPSNFQIIADEFSEDNKMINSTLKMVRHKITETYKSRLDLMYGTKAQQNALDENIKVLSTLLKISLNK